MVKKYWLMKSEPTSYSIDDLERERKTPWSGVRNYQARNFMRDDMQIGDGVLFYHSTCKVPGIYGLGQVSSKSYPDPTQFEKTGKYFEPRASKEKPVWFLVDVSFVKKFPEPVSISELRLHKELNRMRVLELGSRLSITSVTKNEFEIITELAV